jgi:hypothetical protein
MRLQMAGRENTSTEYASTENASILLVDRPNVNAGSFRCQLECIVIEVHS